MFMASLPVRSALRSSCPAIAICTDCVNLSVLPGIHVLRSTTKQDVDARDQPGHDDVGPIEFIRLPLSRADLIIQGENASADGPRAPFSWTRPPAGGPAAPSSPS